MRVSAFAMGVLLTTAISFDMTASFTPTPHNAAFRNNNRVHNPTSTLIPHEESFHGSISSHMNLCIIHPSPHSHSHSHSHARFPTSQHMSRNDDDSQRTSESGANNELQLQLQQEIEGKVATVLKARRDKEIYDKDVQISKLVQQTEQRKTKINRLKFQLTEFRQAVEESEEQKANLQTQLEAIQKKKNEDKESSKEQMSIMEQLKAQFVQEKDSLEEDVKATKQKLTEVELQSKKQLDRAQQDAEQEKEQLLTEIQFLQTALEQTTERIDNAKKEMDDIANNTTMEFTKQQEEVSQKDNEIGQLTQEKQELIYEMDELFLQLDEFKATLKESEQQTTLLLDQMNDMQKESEEARKADQDLISKIKSQFDSERKTLTDQVETYNTKLQRIKVTKEEEMKQVQVEKDALASKLMNVQTDLEVVREEYEKTKITAETTVKKADERVKAQKEESKRFDRVVKSIAAQEKKEFKRQIWNLESKLDSAQYKTIQMKASAKEIQKEIKDLEQQKNQEIGELEEKVLESEALQVSAKERTSGLVAKFRRRLTRRERKAQEKLEKTRTDLTNKMENKVRDLNAERENAIKALRIEAENDMNATKDDFDTQITTLNTEMDAAREKAEKQIENLKSTHEAEIKYERIKSEREKDILMDEMKTKMQIQKAGDKRAYDTMKIDMTQKLNNMTEKKEALEDVVSEKNNLIVTYEDERSSFRKLAKSTWSLAKERIAKRRKKGTD